MRAIALLTLFCFGCATVRVPVSAATEPADAPGTVAPPVVEVWLEDTGPVSPAQADRAGHEARAALDAALGRVHVPAHALGAGDAVLFVRERAVALTDARRKQQTWAKVGLVVGFVAVVAVVVVAAVAGGKSRGGSSPAKAPPAPAARAATAPAAVPVRPQARAIGAAPRPVASAPRPVAVPPASLLPPRPPPAFFAGGYAYSPAPFILDFEFFAAPRPLVLRSDAPPDGFDGPPDVAGEEGFPGAPPPPAEESAAELPSPKALALPPIGEPADFAVEKRGYFSGAQTGLQLDLLDRATGEVLWSKAVGGDANPLDERELAPLLASALAAAPWAVPPN